MPQNRKRRVGLHRIVMAVAHRVGPLDFDRGARNRLLGISGVRCTIEPPDLSLCWLFLGGRGAGKSHTISAAVHMALRTGLSRIHLIAPTTRISMT
jgi:phage terminase large subunit-like protein